jgi:hypothetical protein
MAKFSDAFLQGLRGGGRRGSPTDPMLQRADQYGSSNPLAKSIGGMFGMDMRTAPELINADMSTFKTQNPQASSAEALKQSILTQAKYEQDPQKQMLMLSKLAELDKTKTQENALSNYFSKNSPGFKDLADSGIITSSNIHRFIGSTADPAKYSFNTSGKVIDTKGNIYDRVVKRKTSGSGAGDVEVILVGAPDSPEKPIGKTMPVGGQFDETAEEAAKTAGEKELERKWAQTKASATEVLPEALSGRNQAQTALALARSIETGGFTESLKQSATNFLGITPTDRGQFEALTQNMMINMLSNAIKGNPTGREMDEIKKLMPAISKSKGLNIALLEQAANELDKLVSRSEYLMTEDVTREGYSRFVVSQYPTKEDLDKEAQQAADDAAFYLKQAQDAFVANGDK